jgi:hypothetical protein
MHFSTLVNGTPNALFGTSHGLRQGKPFVSLTVCYHHRGLSKMISAIVNEGLLLGFFVRPRNPFFFFNKSNINKICKAQSSTQGLYKRGV